MVVKEKSECNTWEMIRVEGLVPPDHLPWNIDAAIDFTHIYDFVEDFYCDDNERSFGDCPSGTV